MPTREFHRGATLTVWLEYDDSTLTFSGQDLGGYPGASEYEYWLTVSIEDLRKVLGAGTDADIGELLCARAAEIVSTGEMRWLERHGVDYEFDSRTEWGDD